MKIQGLKPYSMTAKDTGELLEGVTLHCTFEDKHIFGNGVEKFSISKQKLDGIDLEPGMEVEPLYNKYGKVSSIRVVSNARAY